MLSDDSSLTITVADTIYRGENLSKKITFLIPTKVSEVDLESATVFLSYIRADGSPDMVILNRSETPYNPDYYQYTIPVTCKMSRYPGEVCMWLQICTDGTHRTVIAKSGECILRIQESKRIDACDHQLTAMYQLKKKIDSLFDAHDSDCAWGDMEDSIDSEYDDSDVWEDM